MRNRIILCLFLILCPPLFSSSPAGGPTGAADKDSPTYTLTFSPQNRQVLGFYLSSRMDAGGPLVKL